MVVTDARVEGEIRCELPGEVELKDIGVIVKRRSLLSDR